MHLRRYSAASAELDDIETTLGELGAMLTRVANALVMAPDRIRLAPCKGGADREENDAEIYICANDWPTGQEIIALLEKRKLLRDFLAAGYGSRGLG